MGEKPFVTMCFAFDIKTFGANPFLVDTPYGLPEVVSLGNVFAEAEEAQSAGTMDGLREALDLIGGIQFRAQDSAGQIVDLIEDLIRRRIAELEGE